MASTTVAQVWFVPITPLVVQPVTPAPDACDVTFVPPADNDFEVECNDDSQE